MEERPSESVIIPGGRTVAETEVNDTDDLLATIIEACELITEATDVDGVFTVLEQHLPRIVEHTAGCASLAGHRPRCWGASDGSEGRLTAPLGPKGSLELRGSQPFAGNEIGAVSLVALQATQRLHVLHGEHVRADLRAQLLSLGKMAGLGQLAAGVTHEMNGPLGSILLGIQAAQAALERNPERAVSKLATAEKAALQARGIVRKLLFYAREGHATRRDFSLNDVVNDTLELFAHQLSIDTVRVEVDLCDPLPLVNGHQGEIRQVLTNLLLNARDAVAPTLGSIRVSTRSESDHVALCVSDDGSGVSPEASDDLFEPFFTTKAAGTGLGLSISRQIAESHHGALTLDHPRGPTVFCLRLPVLEPGIGHGRV